jgi:hypothetical protein
MKFFWFSRRKRDGYDIPIYTDEKLIKKGKKMVKKLEVKVPAIKEKSGKIVKAPSKAWSHDELIAKEGKKAKGAKHEFELTDGEIVNRKKAAKVAEKAGEVPKSVGKKLHSHDLRKAARIKKITKKDL